MGRARTMFWTLVYFTDREARDVARALPRFTLPALVVAVALSAAVHVGLGGNWMGDAGFGPPPSAS